MPQNDPRAEMSSFDSFGIYSSASESNQRIESNYVYASFDSDVVPTKGKLEWHVENTSSPGLGWVPHLGGGQGFMQPVSDSVYAKATIYMEDTEGSSFSGPVDGGFSGWLRTGSVARTYDGYQAIPVAVSCMHSYFSRMAEMFFGPNWGQLVERDNVPYHQITGTQNAAQNYFWACPRQAGLPEGSKPYYYTNTDFIDFKSIYDSSPLTSSAEVLMGRIFQASGAILALLSGGTLANYGSSISSDQVVRDTIAEVQTSVDEENLSICSRLERIESAVAQLIALTTYNYYTGGARVDSPKTEKPATGIFDLLLSYLGFGRPVPEPEPESESDSEEGE